jgi:2-dehydro-3-deoxyphosphogluconate aldolase/(4S)-4-hydroxy-2-oxoglutarate aldolase
VDRSADPLLRLTRFPEPSSIPVNPSVPLVLKHRLVAILRLNDLKDAVPLAESLVRAGVRALEFTLTNASAPIAIRSCLDRIASFSNGTAAIGIGSVRNLAEARIAIDCGSQFVVSPITSKPIIDFCKEHGVSVFPGAFSPTEIAMAHEAGADIVKVFPSRNLGPSYIQDVLAPMPYLRLMPTGGVDLKNLANYFRAGAVAVGVGGQFLDAEAIARQDWQRIESLASQFVAACERE